MRERERKKETESEKEREKEGNKFIGNIYKKKAVALILNFFIT